MLDVEEESEALEQLTVKGLVPFQILPSHGPQKTPWWARDIRVFGEAYDRPELIRFLSSLQGLLAAQFPLVSSLELAGEDARNRAFKDAMAGVVARVRGGDTLSSAFDGQSGLIPVQVHVLIGVGERSNTLPTVLADIVEMLRAEEDVVRRVRAATTYPLILACAAVLVLLGLVFLLTPAIEPIFGDIGAEAPLSLQLMVGLRQYLSSADAIWGAFALALLVLGMVAAGRRRLGGLKWRFPILGAHLRLRDAQRFAGSLGLMIGSGATLIESLDVTREVVRNPKLRKELGEVIAEVRRGVRLGDALNEGGLFPATLVQAVRIGERNNRLAATLVPISAALQGRLDEQVMRMTTLLSPLLTVLIGVLVGSVVLSTLTAILDLNDLVLQP